MQYNLLKIAGMFGAVLTAGYQIYTGNVVEGTGILAAALTSPTLRTGHPNRHSPRSRSAFNE